MTSWTRFLLNISLKIYFKMSFLAFLCFSFHTCDAAEVMKGKYDAVGWLLFELYAGRLKCTVEHDNKISLVAQMRNTFLYFCEVKIMHPYISPMIFIMF